MVFYASTKWNLERKKSVKKTIIVFTGQPLITEKSPTFPPPWVLQAHLLLQYQSTPRKNSEIKPL